MKTKWICTMYLLLCTYQIYASGIHISDVQVKFDTGVRTGRIVFSVAWEYSWKISTQKPKNWDAAWVFAKYRIQPAGDWHHIYLSGNTSRHRFPANATLEVGLSNLSLNNNNGVGVFIHRKADGNSPVIFKNIDLEWNLVKNNLTGKENIEVCVFALEMVYVPEGAFRIGDGISKGSFVYKNTKQPYMIDNPNKPDGFHNEDLDKLDNVGDRNTNTLPTKWPNGYRAFYCMKYEITQSEYTAFLNRIPVNVQGQYWQSNQHMHRYGIRATGNNSYSVNDASSRVACNYMGTEDIRAWLVWAGLRPMTEFEFEKACRGPETPVPNEYAWGNTVCKSLPSINHWGTDRESPVLHDKNCSIGTVGPVRVGAFATSTSDRTKSGSSYYGIMELSGNVYERCVTFGLDEGRKFLGSHGNGEIGTNPAPACPADWPQQPGLGYRGGCFDMEHEHARAHVSNRDKINSEYLISNNRQNTCGGRGVRTAPGLADVDY